MKTKMIFLPVSLNITGKDIIIIGGGNVAFQKIKLLLLFTDKITVVAKEICKEIKQLKLKGLVRKAFEPSDLDGFFLVYAATNLNELNKKVSLAARKRNILVNVVDNVPYCDFVSPAIYKNKQMTVAVGSNGEDVKASIALRNEIRQFLIS
jgi:siroheme synthase-like protein